MRAATVSSSSASATFSGVAGTASRSRLRRPRWPLDSVGPRCCDDPARGSRAVLSIALRPLLETSPSRPCPVGRSSMVGTKHADRAAAGEPSQQGANVWACTQRHGWQGKRDAELCKRSSSLASDGQGTGSGFACRDGA